MAPTPKGSRKLPNVLELVRGLLRRSRRRDRPKTILFAPLDSLGHINSLISIANHLRAQNHRTVFLFIEPIANTLKDDGHEVYDCTTADLVESSNTDAAQDKWNEVIISCRDTWKSGDVIANVEQELSVGFGSMVEDIKKYNENIDKKLSLLKPDVLVLDHCFAVPAYFTKRKLPWLRVFSASPLALHNHPDLPVAWLGLPTKWDKSDHRQGEMVDRALNAKMALYDTYNSYWKSFGHSDLPREPVSYIPLSPYLNIYMYPEELDYSPEYALPGWERCDCMVRDFTAAKFDVPDQIRDKPGKLIFLSLGSLASADVELMRRLTSMLADAPHKFIVCKGPLHDQYELPDNMWGDKFVPQLEVLTCVDMIITHGGNNTITESFYYGVPGFVVCPLFGDQFDNATRLEEKGLGIRLDPYNCTKDQLHDAIETILSKQDIKERMKAISERMRAPEARNRAAQLVSDVVARL